MVYQISFGRRVFLALNTLLCIGIAVVVLLPMWMIVATSLAPDIQVVKGEFVLWPTSFNLDCYKLVLQSGYMQGFMNSLFVTGVGTLLSMLLTTFTGYALAQPNLIFRKFFWGFVLVTMVFNAGVIPFYVVVRNLGLINTYTALFLPVLIQTYNLILMKNYFLSIPEGLIEAARLDGCSEIGILFRIVLPVSIPILAAITLFYVVFYWNQYLNVVMFINDSAKYTIQVLLRQLVFDNSSIQTGQNRVYTNFKMTVMLMTMLPVLAGLNRGIIKNQLSQKHLDGIFCGIVDKHDDI
jgi:putative aldouronate transport system permease protein